MKQTLKRWLNQAAVFIESGGDPIVTPPLYGAGYADQIRVEAENSPQWFNALNLDPRYRIAAAVGGDIVQRYQEEFVAAVCAQMGELPQANSLIRGAQMAQAVSDRLVARHLDPLPAGMLLSITGTQQHRMRSDTGSQFTTFSNSTVSPSTLDSSLRRVSRIRGPMMRRWSGSHGLGEAPYLLQQQVLGQPPKVLTGVVVDEGKVNAPSRWTSEPGWLVQTSPIADELSDRNLLPKLGTYFKLGSESWQDYSASMIFLADDNDVGMMFRYRDAKNYYRFSLCLERSYQRLVKCVNGEFFLLWQRDQGFTTKTWNHLEIIVNNHQLRGYWGGNKLFNLIDDSHRSGAIACYCAGTSRAKFGSLTVRDLNNDSLITQINRPQQPGEPKVQLQLNAVKQSVLSGLDSRTVVRDRTRERVRFGNPVAATHAISATVMPTTAPTTLTEVKPIQWSPDLPQPLVRRLAEQAPNLLLPGMTEIPDATVLLVEPNPAFIASFMVGANHEMMRELLWRGLDIDVRSTIFRQFWDVRGGRYHHATVNTTAPVQDAYKDIAPIHTWSATQPLHQQLKSTNAPASIILIRSEFVRRFPEARYALVEGTIVGTDRTPGTNVVLPLFRGQLTDDMAYFAFSISPSIAQSHPGWYLMIEQPMMDSQFGLDQYLQGPAKTWADLAWNHFAESPYLNIADLQTPPIDRASLTWGTTAAQTAAITLQKPVRLFIHMKRLVGMRN